MVGDQVVMQGGHGQDRDHDSGEGPGAKRHGDLHDGISGLGFVEGRVEDDDGEGGSDGVDDDPLPAQDAAAGFAGSSQVQERNDDGRTGDDENRTDEGRVRRRHVEEQQHRAPADQPGHQRSERHEPQNHRATLGEPIQFETEPTLEQQQANCERNDREEHVAEILDGVDDAHDRTDRDTGGQQQQNARDPQPTGQPLAADTEDQDDRDRERQRALAGQDWGHATRL